MRIARPLTALLGGGLLATSMAVGTAATATATTTGAATVAAQRAQCRVSLDQRGSWLVVNIRSNTRNETADVRANYNQGPDQRDRVRLGRDGDAITRFRIPNRADFVRVRVHIDSDRGRDVTCSDALRLR